MLFYHTKKVQSIAHSASVRACDRQYLGDIQGKAALSSSSFVTYSGLYEKEEAAIVQTILQ